MILCLCKVGQWNCIPQCPNSLYLAFETSRIIVPLLLHVKQVQHLSSKSKTCQASPKLDKQVQNLSSKSKACQANSKLSSKSKTCQTNPKLVNQVQNWSGKSKTCQASGALKFLKVKGILWSILQFVCVASGKTLSSGQFGTSDNLTLGTI